jgi:holo-[acyl-carrier protein] synthase
VIVGVGIDVVQVDRLARALTRTPRLGERLFTEGERAQSRTESLAARFAAKEAVAKALGAPGGLRWRDAEVVSDPSGRPRLLLHGAVAEEAASQGITTWHLSMSHDGGVATAVVVAEG